MCVCILNLLCTCINLKLVTNNYKAARTYKNIKDNIRLTIKARRSSPASFWRREGKFQIVRSTFQLPMTTVEGWDLLLNIFSTKSGVESIARDWWPAKKSAIAIGILPIYGQQNHVIPVFLDQHSWSLAC